MTTSRSEAVVAKLAARRAIVGGAIWGAVFAGLLLLTGLGYTAAYPSAAERLDVARGLIGNPAFEALFGRARGIESVGGFTTWRIGHFIALIAAVWGLLTATRLLRGEEDEGRWDTLLSGPVTRVGSTAATLVGILAGTLALFAVTAAGALILAAAQSEVSAGSALYMSLAITVTAPAFVAVGSLTSQLAPSRREAAGLAAAIFAIGLLARVASDSSESLDWLRWATPFGWAIELRPFSDPEPLFLLPLIGWTVLFGLASLALTRGRDVDGALLRFGSDRGSRRGLLSFPAALALRAALGGVLGWAAGLALFGIVFGLLATDVADTFAEIAGLNETLRDVGYDVSLATAEGYLGVIFLFVAIAISLYPVTHVTDWRDEESHGRIDMVFAQPHGRRSWLVGRAMVALAATISLALLTGVATWLGAAIRNSGVGLGGMLEAGLNTVPIATLFLGLGVLFFATVPRQAGPALYGLIAAAFAWNLTGSIINAPQWLVGLSPFHHLAVVPAEPIDLLASGAMIAFGLIAAAVGIESFRRRDLTGP
jgi:ABC-2 type transport system permease protein